MPEGETFDGKQLERLIVDRYIDQLQGVVDSAG